MSEPEYPALTDAELIKKMLRELDQDMQYLSGRLDAHANAVNSIGENLTWLVNTLQGVMEMFNNPAMMGQLMGKVTTTMTLTEAGHDGKHAAATS